MALLSPGIGDLGTYVSGTAKTTGSIANGQEGIIGSLQIPSDGVWVVTATGWWPSDISSGYVYLANGSTGLGGQGMVGFQFSLSGIVRMKKGTVELRITNWSGNTVSGIAVGGLKLLAVKVGNL